MAFARRLRFDALRVRPGQARRTGMTLVEVLVSAVLLGVGVAGLLSAAALGLRNQDRSGHEMGALYFAQEMLALVDREGPRMWELTRPTKGVEQRGPVRYTYRLDIEALTEGELHSVIITVDWETTTDSGQIELETLMNDFEAATVLDVLPTGDESPLSPEMTERR